MTKKQRMQDYLAGKPTDFVPLFPKISYAAAPLTGRTVGAFMTDPDAMAQSLVEACETFGWDAIGITTDISLNGMALGSEYLWSEDKPYVMKKRLMDRIGDIDRIVVPDPWEAPGHSQVLRATQKVRGLVGEDVYVQAWTNGPLNIASQLLDMTRLMMGMRGDTAPLHRLLRICADASIAFARELVRAGADAVAFGHAMASRNLISQEMYRTFALPYEQELVRAIQEEGGVAITHICGTIQPIISDIAENGSEIIDFDSVNQFAEMHSVVPNRFFRGDISPERMSQASPQEIRALVQALLREAKDTRKLILGTGCEVNTDVPKENLVAFVAAGREYGAFS